MADLARYNLIKAETIAHIQEDTFHSYFRDLPLEVLESAFDHAYHEIPRGLTVILDYVDPITGNDYVVEIFSNLVCHYLIAFELKPYLVEEGGKWIIQDAGALPAQFRTVGTQSMDGVSVSFESERLGIDIGTPFEQWLSTTSWGFRCIQPFKDATLRKGRYFVF